MNIDIKKKYKEDNKLLILEILRFISAFSVLIWHYQLFFFVGAKPFNLEVANLPLYSFLQPFYNFGLYGVIVFWGISGFIFFWKYGDIISTNRFDAKKFFIYRFSRLYPLHFLTLILVAILQYFYLLKFDDYFVYKVNDLFHFFLHIFFASNWGFERDYSFNGPIWSVSAEIFSYIIFFYSLKKFGKSFFINFLIITFCVILRILKLSNPITDCLTTFFVCGSAALIYKLLSSYSFKKKIYYIILLISVVIPLIVVKFDLYKIKHFTYIFEFFYIPLILFLSANGFKFLDKFRHFIECVGNTTYASYLLHFPTQLFLCLICSVFEIKIDFYDNFFFATYLLIIYSMSYFTYSYFEKPIQIFIRKITIKH